MLKTGERIGDISKVLPACRALLNDGVSQVRGALNYVVLLAFAVTPFTVFVPLMLRIKVLPSYKPFLKACSRANRLPAFTRFVFGTNGIAITVQVGISLSRLASPMFAYIGGPRLQRWLQYVLRAFPIGPRGSFPWRRKTIASRFLRPCFQSSLMRNVPEVEGRSAGRGSHRQSHLPPSAPTGSVRSWPKASNSLKRFTSWIIRRSFRGV